MTRSASKPSSDNETAGEQEAEQTDQERAVQDNADQGDSKAQWTYASKYAEGEERIGYLCRAAKQGERNAQLALGRMLDEGDFYPDALATVDPVRAYMWYALSTKIEPVPMATEHRDDLVTSMTPAQIAEGERLAAEWTPESQCP